MYVYIEGEVHRSDPVYIQLGLSPKLLTSYIEEDALILLNIFHIKS